MKVFAGAARLDDDRTNLAGSPEHAATVQSLAGLMKSGWKGALPVRP